MVCSQLQSVLFGLLLAVWQVSMLGAQDTTELGPLEPSDTSNPAATLTSLIDSCNALHEFLQDGPITAEREAKVLPTTERILDCLDLSELPKELRWSAGIESALFLKEILDRIQLPTPDQIPDASTTPTEDETWQSWMIPRSRLAIGRIGEGPRRGEWLFTKETVRNASEYFRIVSDLPYRVDGPAISAGLHTNFTEATKKRPTLTADTSSPRGTLTLFLDSCNELHDLTIQDKYFNRNDPKFQELGLRIISCLDSSQLPDYTRDYYDAEAAVCLKEVLDRISLPPAEQIPGIETVESVDGGEALTRWQIPRSQIVIAKITEGPQRGEFLFSAETVKRAEEFYRKSLSQPYRQDGRRVSEGLYDWWLSRPGNPAVARLVDRLPDAFQNRLFGLAIWQWIGLFAATPIALAILVFAWRMGNRSRFDPSPSQRHPVIRHWLSLVFPMVVVLIPLAFKHILWEYLTLRGQPLYVANFCADLTFLLGVVFLIERVSGRIAESIIALPRISPRGLDANLIRIVCRLIGIAAAVVVFLEGGRYLGFPITTLIASAGIGGLAIALSAQGLIKGLFGTMTILLDRPYRVGDRIIARGHEGIVEEIGLRSTKIRAVEGRLISIPNDIMSEVEIQKIGTSQFLRRKTAILIPLDTPRESIKAAVDSIREILKDHEGQLPHLPPQVYFSEFEPGGFRIAISYWFSPADYRQFINMSEQVNLEIMRVFEDRGIQFSLPLRHSYWKEDDQQGPLEITVSRATTSSES